MQSKLKKYKSHRTILQIIALLLANICFLILIMPIRASAANSLSPGESGFMALSQYLTPTNIPNVYKVALTVEPTIKPTLIDIVIVINEGHYASHVNSLQDSASLPQDAFGYKLDTDGNTTTNLRNIGPNNFSIFNAELFSAEQIIRKLADPAINPSYESTRIAIISYGVGGKAVYQVLNRAGLVSLKDSENVKFLLSKIGILDQTTTYLLNNPVPLGRSTQQAYQILEDSSVPLFFTYPSTDFTTGDNNLNYPAGVTIPGNLTNGTWKTPPGTTINDFDSINKYIVSLHCIGSSIRNNDINTTIYPLKIAATPTSFTTNAASSLPSSQWEITVPSSTFAEFPAYDSARYAIKMVSDKLRGNQAEKVFHSFTFWIDPDNLADKNSYSWLDFNQTISAFPLSTTPIIAGSGYTSPNPARPAMLFNKHMAASRGYTYENREGVQYWSDAAQTHNIRNYSDFDPEISGLVEQFASYAKNGVVDIDLEDRFEIYDYPGVERFSVFVRPDTNPAHDGGTVSYTNKHIKWNLGALPQQGSIALSFYVYFDGDGTDIDLSYLFSKAELTYDFKDKAERKSFPYVYLQGGTIINEENQNIMNSIEDGSGNTIYGNGVMPSGTIPQGSSMDIGRINIFATPMPAYTPSITPTPKPTVIVDEVVDEGTVEVPATGEEIQWIIIAFVAIFAGIALVIQKNKKGKHK